MQQQMEKERIAVQVKEKRKSDQVPLLTASGQVQVRGKMPLLK